MDASVVIGEVLTCERDHDNVHDKYAIRNYGEIEAECIGARYNKGKGKGLEIPVDYKLKGNYKYLEKLVSRIKGRESTSGLNISEVNKCTRLMFQTAEPQATQGPKKTITDFMRLLLQYFTLLCITFFYKVVSFFTKLFLYMSFICEQ